MPSYSRLLVASAKGGVGKSTTALGLAVAFAREGKRVMLIDLDVTSRSLDMLTGASDMTVRDISDTVCGSSPREAAVHPIEKYPEIAFIAACSGERVSVLANERDTSIEKLVREMVKQITADCEFDVLICDTGGGCDIPIAIADLCDFTIITSEQGLTSVRAAEYAAARLEKAGASQMRLVICGFDLTAVKREKRAGVVEMIDRSSLPCVGVVPYDRKLQRAQDEGVIPSEKSLSSMAYTNIAKRISGTEIPLFHGMGKLYRKRTLAF